MVNKKNILIFGSEGQLGKSIKSISKKFKNYYYFFMNREQLDIRKCDEIIEFVKIHKIDTIVNCAAYTKVLEAEIEQNLADEINNYSVKKIAQICESQKVQLIHISTDYVFDGKKETPYNEEDITNPINKYGLSKLNGEKNILKLTLNNSVIIRTSWLYSNFKNNFVSNIVKQIRDKNSLKVIEDEFGSPTYSIDLATLILEIIPRLKNIKTQIYHYSNLGYCSRIEFAKQICIYKNSPILIEPLKIKSNNIRPKFSALDSRKIKREFNLTIPHWKTSLKNCILN